MKNNTALDKEEQWIEDHMESYVPADEQNVMRKELEVAANKLKGRINKKTVTINLDETIIYYFKDMAEETGVPYQRLINLYLTQCVNEKKRLFFL